MTIRQQIIQILQSQERCTMQEFKQKIPSVKNCIQPMLSKLVKEGKIRRIYDGCYTK